MGRRLPSPASCRRRGDRPRRAEAADRPQRAGQLHLRPYLSYRHPCHVALLLAGERRHRSFNDVRTVVVPPPQMVMNMRIGNMSGFCVGEPWNARAINDRIFTAATSGISGPSIRKGAGHPSRLGGTQPEHRPRAGGGPDGGAALDRRLAGEHPGDGPPARQTRLAQYQGAIPHRPDAWRYDNGLGRRWQDAHPMRFWAGGEVSFLWLSDGMWFPPSSAAGVAEAGSGLPRGGVAH